MNRRLAASVACSAAWLCAGVVEAEDAVLVVEIQVAAARREVEQWRLTELADLEVCGLEHGPDVLGVLIVSLFTFFQNWLRAAS
jgi:hypothetical protein